MNEQGFTLVEIVITLAVGAIVSLAIGKSFIDYFNSYGQMSTTQIQTMALNGVNEIVNNRVEDAMKVDIQPGDYVLQENEYAIYANGQGDLMLSDSSGNVTTMFTNNTGAINILNLFVEKDGQNLDQLRFKYVYTDGSSDILSLTLTTQLFNVQEVAFQGNSYSGDSDTFLLQNDSAANILVFTEASLISNKPEDPSVEQFYAILSYYLGDPSFTPEDPQVYFYGMVYWDGTGYQVFNNRTYIAYGDEEMNLSEVHDYGDFFDPTIRDEIDPDWFDKAGNNIKIEEGIIVTYEGKYYIRQRAKDGNNGIDDPDNFKSTIGGRFVEVDPYEKFQTDLSSEAISSIGLSYYDANATYQVGDIVYKDGALYDYTGSGWVELASLYNEAMYPNLIVDKDEIINADIYLYDPLVSYNLNDYVVYSYDETNDGQKEIYKKVLANPDLTDPSDLTQRLSGGWQLQTNQYDPDSCYVAGNQVLVFGDQNDEIYVITFKTSNVNDPISRALLDGDVEACYQGNTSNVNKTDYVIEKYVF